MAWRAGEDSLRSRWRAHSSGGHMSRILRAAVAALFILVAATPTLASAKPARTTTTSTTQLFAPSSIWNAPLASDAPLDASSSARMSAVVAEIQNEKTL